MRRATFGNRWAQAVVAGVFALVTSAAHAVFVSGNFDPPDLSGSHTFELVGTCLHSGSYVLTVNDSSGCDVTLTRLSVQLDHSFNLDFSSFLPYTTIFDIEVTNGQLTGVDTGTIGPAVGSGAYAGNWWIQFYFNSGDPVNLYHNCTECLVATAFNVTFFLSDANGNPIPEPAPLALLAGALGAAWFARRRTGARS